MFDYRALCVWGLVVWLLQTAEYFTDRTDVQCLHRWQKVLNPALVKGPWTEEVRPAFFWFELVHGLKRSSTSRSLSYTRA
jgi:cytochrome c oxidase subunit IV